MTTTSRASVYSDQRHLQRRDGSAHGGTASMAIASRRLQWIRGGEPGPNTDTFEMTITGQDGTVVMTVVGTLATGNLEVQ